MTNEGYLATLRTYWKRHLAFPSMAKLCDVVGLASTSSVFALVGRLTEAGYLERIEGRIAPTKQFFARPLVSRVRAVVPLPVGQDAVELLTIDDYLIDSTSRTVLCRVRGDSMKNEGLLDGDIVTVEKNVATKAGDIVVAIVENEYTLKTLRPNAQGRYSLQPANAAFADIQPVGALDIFGSGTGSFRRMRQ